MNEPKSSLTASDQPSPELIREHLERVLGSDVFSGAARQQRLLRHLVERHLQGRTAELKEYSLGVEVFDRGEAFDPRLDPIVRVEASRLRNRLSKYYDRPDRDDKIRIELPRGAYVPAFVERNETPNVPEPVPVVTPPPPQVVEAAAEPAPAPAKPSVRWKPAGIVAIALLAAAAAWWFLGRLPDEQAPRFSRFVRVTNESLRCTTPTLSVDGQTIVYARRDPSGWHLYQRKLGGTEAVLLSGDSSTDQQPAFSPDGSQIAFRSEREGGGIFVMRSDGSGVRRLANVGYNPAWSPDAKQIAVSTDAFYDAAENTPDRQSRLGLIDVGTGNFRQLPLADGVNEGMQPAWSPDGSRIAFWGTDRLGNRQIWTFPLTDVKAARPVTEGTSINWAPAWSPDGKRLFFSSDRGGSMNLWSVAIDQATGEIRGKPEPVTTPASYSSWPALSKDGNHLAYVRKLYSSKLFSAPISDTPIDASAMRELTSGPRRVREPDMSPDRSLIVARIQDPQEDLVLLKPDGSDFRRLTNDPYTDRGPRWSPDGTRIIFLSNRSGGFEVWSIRPDGSGLERVTRSGAVSIFWGPDGSLMNLNAAGKVTVVYPPGKPPIDLQLPPRLYPLKWSPDKKLVAGRMARDLVLYSYETKDIWHVTSSGIHSWVDWSDNNRFAFSTDDGFFLADVKKRTVRPLITNLQKKGDIHTRFTTSRDGKLLYVVLAQDEEDVWTATR